MCCPTKENTCFFLLDRLFCCHFDGLIVLLKSFSSSVGTSYALCPRKLRYRHNLFLPLVWPTKRGREQSVERVSANLLPATFLCIGHTFQGMDFNKTIFQYFSLLVFSFLGGGSKSRIVCRRRSRSYSGGDKSLTRLPPTPPTCLTKP